MLRHALIHPPLLAAVGAAGHGAQILLADANYPHSTGRGPRSQLIHLNLSPGLVTVDQVLAPLLDAVPVESAAVMLLPDRSPVPAHNGYRTALGPPVEVHELERFDFYAAVRGDDVAVVVATGDQRICANLLLTIGVRPPGEEAIR